MLQTEKVYDYLKHHAYITSWIAFREFGITRLSSVIYDLRRQGHEITTLLKESRGENRTKYAAYYLEEKHA